MKHKELKKTLLIDGTYAKFNQLQRAYFKFAYNGIFSDSQLVFFDDNGEAFTLDEFIVRNSNFGDSELLALKQLSNAYAVQRRSLNEHIKYLFKRKDLELVFITFTFNDFALSLDSKTRRNFITRLLNSIPFVVDYIGNIDYGKSNNREHYHYIVAFDSEKFNGNYLMENRHFKLKEFAPYLRYGNYDLKPVTRDMVDYKKVSSYIAKLTNHALKVHKGSLITKRDSDFQRWKKDQDIMLKHKKLTHEVNQTILVGSDKYLLKPKQLRFNEELANSGFDELSFNLLTGDLRDFDI